MSRWRFLLLFSLLNAFFFLLQFLSMQTVYITNDYKYNEFKSTEVKKKQKQNTLSNRSWAKWHILQFHCNRSRFFIKVNWRTYKPHKTIYYQYHRSTWNILPMKITVCFFFFGSDRDKFIDKNIFHKKTFSLEFEWEKKQI